MKSGICVWELSSDYALSVSMCHCNCRYQLQNVAAGNICGFIASLDANQESTASGATPSITSALHTPPPTYEGSTLTHALKFQTVASGVQCTIQILYPGTDTNSEDKMGMFNGMKWKDFITRKFEPLFRVLLTVPGKRVDFAPAALASLLALLSPPIHQTPWPIGCLLARQALCMAQCLHASSAALMHGEEYHTVVFGSCGCPRKSTSCQ
jgi:hypothetical protein